MNGMTVVFFLMVMLCCSGLFAHIYYTHAEEKYNVWVLTALSDVAGPRRFGKDK